MVEDEYFPRKNEGKLRLSEEKGCRLTCINNQEKKKNGDLLEHWRRLVQNRREAVDLLELIEWNHYLPNDYHDLYPFFSKLFPPILWYFHPDLHHPLARSMKNSKWFFFLEWMIDDILWEHYSSTVERFLLVKYVFHLSMSSNWKQLKTKQCIELIEEEKTRTHRRFFHRECHVNTYSFQ